MEGITLSKPYESYESGDYLANNPTWDEEDSEWKANQVLKVFDRNHLVPKSIVEVGCGAGGVLALLHNALPEIQYSGFDIAPDASQFWKKHASKKIEFLVGDFLQSQTTHFDVLLLLDVIEHVANPFEFLSSLRGRADYYVFHIPLDLSAISVARETPLLLVRQKVGHIHYFTKGLALSLLEECGYQLIDWSYTGASLTAPQSTWKGLLARLPRRLIFGINRDLGVRLLGGDTLMVLANAKHNK
jgi:SAM-dependent methyltransferase